MKDAFARPKEIWFGLGKLVVTESAKRLLYSDELTTAFARHAEGEWGEISEGEAWDNHDSVLYGGRIRSVYQSKRGVTYTVTTEGCPCGAQAITTVRVVGELPINLPIK